MAWERAISTDSAHESYWLAQSRYSDTVITVVSTSLIAYSKVTLTWTRSTPAGTNEDVASVNFHIANIGGLGVYSSLTDAQKAAAEVPLKAFLDSLKTKQSNQWSFAEIIWHDASALDAKYGPADRRTAYTAVGTQTGARYPDQDAATVTFRTASRKHWGRIYVPGIDGGQYDTTYGRLTNAVCDNLATYTRTLLLALEALATPSTLCVVSRQYAGLLTIDEISVDNVVDIQRRRRAKKQSYRKSFVS